MEADRDGTTLAVEAGYSYTGLLQLLGAFRKLESEGRSEPGKDGGPLGEAAHLSLETLGGYLASHPQSEMRAESVRELATERHWKPQGLTPLHSGGKAALRLDEMPKGA